MYALLLNDVYWLDQIGQLNPDDTLRLETDYGSAQIISKLLKYVHKDMTVKVVPFGLGVANDKI